MMSRDSAVPKARRERGEPTTPVCVAEGIPNREAKKLSRAQAALDSEWEQLSGMKCRIVGSVMEYDDIRKTAQPAGAQYISGAYFHSASKSTSSSRRTREGTMAESGSRDPSFRKRTRMLPFSKR